MAKVRLRGWFSPTGGVWNPWGGLYLGNLTMSTAIQDISFVPRFLGYNIFHQSSEKHLRDIECVKYLELKQVKGYINRPRPLRLSYDF